MSGYSNMISNNNIKNNWRAIGLGSSHSIIYGNRVINNSESGILIAGSKNNIYANEISKNKWGIYFTPQIAAPSENKIYHNNFVSNIYNVYLKAPYNVQIWDDGYPSGGNFWSDYILSAKAKPLDASNIGDLPYLISENNTDRYPSLTTFTVKSTINPHQIVPLESSTPNSIVALWSFNEIESSGFTPDMTGKNPAYLGLRQGDLSFTPDQVEGKFGKALKFNGNTYVSITVTPSLEITEDITVDAWINVQEFKNVTYNNIIVECIRTTAALPTRVFGIAVNGLSAENNTLVPQGALIGYVLTKTEGLSEIATTEPVITLNQWTHLVFTRSLSNGMHIYVDGEEKAVTVTSGVQDPSDSLKIENEIYIGHDAVCLIDEISIRNFALDLTAQPFWIQWWLWAALIFSLVVSGAFVYFKRRVH